MVAEIICPKCEKPYMTKLDVKEKNIKCPHCQHEINRVEMRKKITSEIQDLTGTHRTDRAR